MNTSTLLYFPKELATTLHPTVSVFTTGCDPYKFLELIDENNCSYKEKFYYLFSLMEESSYTYHQTTDILKPLYEEKLLSSIWLAYPRNKQAFEKSEEIIAKSKLSKDQLLKIVDPVMASQELMSHILFEKFLELYEDKVEKDIKKLENKSYEESRANVDYKDLINYCDKLFKENSIEDLLIKAYFFRFQAFYAFPNILITNEKLLSFLASLKPDLDNQKVSHYDNMDIIAWEIFRQLTSEYLSQHDLRKQIDKIIHLNKVSVHEIEALKNKCLKLAEQFKSDNSHMNLKDNISRHIKIHTSKEISDLLKLDGKIRGNILDSIFSDEKTWMSLGAFIISLVSGGPLLTAGSALAAISSIAGKTYKELSSTEKKINDSEYALIYRLNS